MGAITEEDEAHYEGLGYDTSNRGEDVGRAGVELEYETILHGQWGEIVFEVDSHGSVVREISRRDAVNGMDVQLSIDLDLQQYAERVLQTQLRLKRAFTAPNPIVQKPDGTRQAMSLNHGPRVFYEAPAGSVIAMNHQTGQIMAMASYPTFDNRWFSQDISGTKFRELFEIRSDTPDCGDEGQPECPLDPDRASLTNRAIQGQYNMGSAFKVFVAWSALHTGLIEGDDYITDSGTYKAEIDRRGPLRSWCQVCVAQLVLQRDQWAVPLRTAQHAAVARRVQRRVLLPLGRALLRHSRHRSPAPPERAAQLRFRRRDRDRPALRVRRPPA